MKTWNLGNTTVRNPERIKAGLGLLKKHFDGKVFDLAAQKSFFDVLLEAKIIEGDPAQEKNKAASGRKWQSVCNKLGLVTRSSRVNGVLTVTEASRCALWTTVTSFRSFDQMMPLLYSADSEAVQK